MPESCPARKPRSFASFKKQGEEAVVGGCIGDAPVLMQAEVDSSIQLSDGDGVRNSDLLQLALGPPIAVHPRNPHGRPRAKSKRPRETGAAPSIVGRAPALKLD